MTSAIYVDRIQIHSYPFASPNRDRNGSPKTCTYGGTLRGRLSSQHEKRHERTAIEEMIGISATRTRNIPLETAEILTGNGWDPEQALLAAHLLILNLGIKGLGITEAGGTNALLFLPAAALEDMAEIAENHKAHIQPATAAMAADLAKAAAKAKKAKGSDSDAEEEDEREDSERSAIIAKHLKGITKDITKSIAREVSGVLHSRNASVAAYGRMLANSPESSVEAAIQTMHSVSTHTVSAQLDSFTAVDDITNAVKGGTGVAHLGEQRFNAATYYKYSVLNVTELIGNLGGDITTSMSLVDAFLRAPFLGKGGGKHASTAPHTLPDLVYAAVRTDRPINFVGAFAAPIPASEGGYVKPSFEALDQHVGAHHRLVGTKGLAGHFHTGLTDHRFANLGEQAESVDLFARAATQSVSEVLGG